MLLSTSITIINKPIASLLKNKTKNKTDRKKKYYELI